MVTPSFVVIVFICMSPALCERTRLELNVSAVAVTGIAAAIRIPVPPTRTSRRDRPDVVLVSARPSADGLNALLFFIIVSCPLGMLVKHTESLQSQVSLNFIGQCTDRSQ